MSIPGPPQRARCARNTLLYNALHGAPPTEGFREMWLRASVYIENGAMTYDRLADAMPDRPHCLPLM